MVPRKESRQEMFACVIRQYGTGLYRSCVSMGEKETYCLGTHQDENTAMASVNRLLEARRNGDIRSPDDLLAFIDQTAHLA